MRLFLSFILSVIICSFLLLEGDPPVSLLIYNKIKAEHTYNLLDNY